MPVSEGYRPERAFAEIGEGFSDPVEAAAFPRHILRYRNQRWAARVGLGELTEAEWCAHFGRFTPLPGGMATPLAMRYHGHQFQVYNPQIGDGRGFLFAQVRDVKDGRLLDLGTKGSGRTPFSRTGDGRLTLKGGVREVLITALLEALGVYTSKSFSLIETGESLYRSDEPSPTRSSVLVRLSHSHIRFGTFQRHAFENSPERLARLVDFSCLHYFPALTKLTGQDKVAAFVAEVAARSADLVASWMAAGFVHGVLNTDNMNITGESFDYGPYRMLPVFDPAFVAAYFDEGGLYAFGRQPQAVFWNLKQLAGALSLICSKDLLVEALSPFGELYEQALCRHFVRRLGLTPGVTVRDRALTEALMGLLENRAIGFEQVFFDWYGGLASEARARQSPVAAHYQGPAFDRFRAALAAYGAPPETASRLAHPYFRRPGPVTLLIDEIENLWADIAERDDWRAFFAKLDAIEELRTALQAPLE